MQGITLAQQGHIVNVLPPQDAAGGALGDRFSMANYRHVSIIVAVGASAAAPTITLKECSAASGGDTTLIGFNFYKEETAGGDTLSAKQAATTSGIAASANDNIFYVIELDARELEDGYPFVELGITQDSADSVQISAVAVLSGARHASDQSDSVLS